MQWESVKDPDDRRKIVYYRYGDGMLGKGGAVAQIGDKWRALRYTRVSPGYDVIGWYDSKKAAKRAVESA